MSSKDRRKKASDVFRETNFVFAKKAPFEEVFPQIEDIKIEVVDTDSYDKPDFDDPSLSPINKSIYGKNVGEFIDCSNTLCYNGGFSICDVIRGMIDQKQTIKEGVATCRGYEGSPKGKKRYGSCYQRFYYRVKIQYKA